jgi:hypothetical protein
LTFRFDNWWHLSKSVHIGENSQILTASNKKKTVSGVNTQELIFIIHESFVATKKNSKSSHDKIATALAGAVLSNAFDREFFPGGNKT